jgi:hypothetical protein
MTAIERWTMAKHKACYRYSEQVQAVLTDSIRGKKQETKFFLFHLVCRPLLLSLGNVCLQGAGTTCLVAIAIGVAVAIMAA